jgi:type II secretory pathway predicted ATPase ExeA
MILKSHFGLTFNPFDKGIEAKHLYDSQDFRQFASRMEYFKESRGFAVIYGEPGVGKTTSIRAFVSKLNPLTHRVIYLPLSSLTVMDFYRHLARGLGLIPAFRKVDMFHQIQEQIANLNHQNGITPVVVLDEAQYLSHGILQDLTMLFNFHLDSKDYAMVLLSGHSRFLNYLNLRIHEALRQRIVLYYEFLGLRRDEVSIYLSSLLKAAGRTDPLFSTDAIEALTSLSASVPRKLNRLAEKAMLLACQQGLLAIDADIVQQARDEVELTPR